MKNKFSYQCSGYVNGKICDNRLGVRRELLQERLLARIKSDLLSDDSVEHVKQKIRKRVAKTDLGNAPIDVERGRELLRGLLAELRIAPRGGYLVAKMGLECQPLLGGSILGSGGTLLRLEEGWIEVELR